MQCRDRVLQSLMHENTGSLPYQIDMTRAFALQVQKESGCADPDEYLGNHLYKVKYKDNVKQANGTELDIFGVTWGPTKDGGDVGVVLDHPIKEPSLVTYDFPDVRHDFALALCDQLEARKHQLFTMFGITMCFFERAWSLRGMENMLMDMIADEPFASALFAAIEQHHMELLDCVLDRDFDAIYFGDDWGQQQGLIMGPQMWRKYIKPAFARMFDKIKSKGKRLCLHSCGDLREVFGDLVDMGMDMYNTLQPEIYDLKNMKRLYGRHVVFYGGISTQQFLPYATPDQVRKKTFEACKILGHDGSYILAPTHSITPDIPMENIMALAQAAQEFHN